MKPDKEAEFFNKFVTFNWETKRKQRTFTITEVKSDRIKVDYPAKRSTLCGASPKDNAKKAIGNLSRKYGNNDFTVTMRETTSDSKKREVTYKGKMVALTQPIPYIVNDKRRGQKRFLTKKNKVVCSKVK